MIYVLAALFVSIFFVWLNWPTRPDEPPVSADHHTAQDWPESPEERREAAIERRLREWEREGVNNK
jgi:hypothetical protein